MEAVAALPDEAALPGLHEEVQRGGARAGFQLAPCPARSADPALLLDALQPGSADEQQRLLALMTLRSESWPTLATLEARKALLAIVPRLEVHPDRVEITIDNAGLAAWLEEEVDGPVPDRPDPTASDRAVTVLTVPVRLKQRGNELRLVIEGAADEAAPNPSLTRVVARAHLVSQRLLHDRATIDDVAREEGLTASYVTRLLRINFLAPDITARLLSGRHDPDLSASKLMADTRLPLDWAKQRQALGFA